MSSQKLATGSSIALPSDEALSPSTSPSRGRKRPTLDRHSVTGTGATSQKKAKPTASTTRAKAPEAKIRVPNREATSKRSSQSLAPQRGPQVLIPRHVDARDIEAPAGHRLCPSPQASLGRGLLRQTISIATCEQRQCGSYHKCAGCVHADRPQWAGRELDALENGPTAHAQHKLEHAEHKKGGRSRGA